jgi:hypothetical protein
MNRILPSLHDPQYEQALERFVKDDLLQAAVCWPVAVGFQKHPMNSDRPLPAACNELIESIVKFSSGPPFPLLLHYIEGWYKNDMTDLQLQQALEIIENLMARTVVCKRPLSPLRAVFMQGMNQLHSSYELSALRAWVMGSSPTNGVIPLDPEVRSSLLTGDFYKGSGVKGPQLGAIFRGIERKLAGNASHRLPYGNQPDDFTVEHIFPQSCVTAPHGAWGSDLQAWGADTDAMALRMNRIGNLTLLTFAANRYLKAKSFDVKKAVFSNGDPECPHPMLSVNSDIAGATQWTATEIDQRTERLADAFLGRWPLPART